MSSSIKVLVLAGPTGVGKTMVASLLSHMIEGEIISCDSVQVYKELIIGANKETSLKVPQHLIDIVSWQEPFSAGDYYDLCMKKIVEISGKGKVPLIVGGTGFYIKWLLHGKPKGPPSTPEIMEEVRGSLRGKTWEESLSELRKVDESYATQLVPNDFYRLHRALAIYKMTGKPLSALLPSEEQDHLNKKVDFRCFYLTNDRIRLAKLIDLRCESMLERGLIQEVAGLLKCGLSENCNGGRAIGYYQTLSLVRALNAYYETHGTIEDQGAEKILLDYILEFQTASRQYSRRQDTWFQQESVFAWCHWDFFENNKEKLADFIKRTFLLSTEHWLSSAELKEVTLKSKSLRFNESYQRDMRNYKPVLEIYNDSEKRLALLNSLKLSLDAHDIGA